MASGSSTMVVPYQYLLLTLASDQARAGTRQAAQVVRGACEEGMTLGNMGVVLVSSPQMWG
jgi:hypothetical protein